jgi:SEC-C motif-containing protein
MTGRPLGLDYLAALCPCGSGERYDDCCGPLLRGDLHAATPVSLMRSRYTAYALGALDYVFRTWHPRTRPERVEPAPQLTWTRLEVLAEEGDEVEFAASYTTAAGDGVLHEHSRFARRAGRWFYLDGDVG